MKCHQAMMRFEKKRQRDDESIDRFLDDLESLRRRSDPEDSTNRRNFSIASKFIYGVKSDNLRTMLATYYTLSKDNALTREEKRQKSREYMLMKPKKVFVFRWQEPARGWPPAKVVMVQAER